MIQESKKYISHGFANRDDYLQYLAREYNVAVDIVYQLANTFGEDEDFDALVTELVDINHG